MTGPEPDDGAEREQAFRDLHGIPDTVPVETITPPEEYL